MVVVVIVVWLLQEFASGIVTIEPHNLPPLPRVRHKNMFGCLSNSLRAILVSSPGRKRGNGDDDDNSRLFGRKRDESIPPVRVSPYSDSQRLQSEGSFPESSFRRDSFCSDDDGSGSSYGLNDDTLSSTLGAHQLFGDGRKYDNINPRDMPPLIRHDSSIEIDDDEPAFNFLFFVD